MSDIIICLNFDESKKKNRMIIDVNSLIMLDKIRNATANSNPFKRNIGVNKMILINLVTSSKTLDKT